MNFRVRPKVGRDGPGPLQRHSHRSESVVVFRSARCRSSVPARSLPGREPRSAPSQRFQATDVLPSRMLGALPSQSDRNHVAWRNPRYWFPGRCWQAECANRIRNLQEHSGGKLLQMKPNPGLPGSPGPAHEREPARLHARRRDYAQTRRHEPSSDRGSWHRSPRVDAISYPGGPARGPTNSTGQSACLRIASASEPSRSRSYPFLPWVPRTIKSTSFCLTAESSSS